MGVTSKKGRFLSSFSVKLIAIAAMTIDHAAWGGVEFYSFAGQLMHIVGRLAIPIMCFCISEGYIHTRNIKNYILRLCIAGIVSVVPFYMFFGNMPGAEYGYRQNNIFDLLIGLLVLVIMDYKEHSLATRIVAIVLLGAVSLILGGWPVIPAVFVCIFYYFRKDFKKMALFYTGAVVLLCVLLVVFSLVNAGNRICAVDWKWYDKLYLLGFLLALPIIRMYNGEKGGNAISGALFYVYYPAHLAGLSLFFNMQTDIRLTFILLQIAAMALTAMLIIMAALNNKSSVHTSIIASFIFGFMFLAGYLGELIQPELGVVRELVKIEYLAQIGFIICFTWFVSEFLRMKISVVVYLSEIVVGAMALWGVYTAGSNDLFYKNFEMVDNGAFPVASVEPGPIYMVYYFFIVTLFIAIVVACIFRMRRTSYIEVQRVKTIIYAMCSMWFFIALKVVGISKYDLISFGVMSGMCCVSYGVMKYGLLNSAASAATNALNHSGEGVIVIDMSGEVLMINDNMKKVFPGLESGKFISKDDGIFDILGGKCDTLEKNGTIYEFRKEPLLEDGRLQSYMLWAIDMTARIVDYRKVQSLAETDSLTGLYNRKYLEKVVTKDLEEGVKGTLFMMDLDNFKYVNDHYGHGTGDAVLFAYGEHIKECVGDIECVICRFGGDEYAMYIPGVTNREEIEEIASHMIERLYAKMIKSALPTIVGSSIGICINNGREKTYEEFYKTTDDALYEAKNNGKNRYRIG